MDQFVEVIKGEIDDELSVDSIIESVPAARIWNQLPMVAIVPKGKKNAKWICFGQRKLTSVYQVFLLKDNQAVNTLDPDIDDFQMAMMRLFKGNEALVSAGAYQTNCDPLDDFDRSQFGKQKTISGSTIEIDWVIEL